MPLERLGKYRESLTVRSEQYKKHFLRYLSGRGYYVVKASSDVEGILPDAILTRKGETCEYWLEVKDEQVSLGDGDFLKQLAKYLAEYLSRSSTLRFKMILAFSQIVNPSFFKIVYEQLNSEAIRDLQKRMAALSSSANRKIIENARFEEVKKFFEDTTVKEADLKYLLFAQERVKPTPPNKPTLSELEYSAKVVTEFGDVSPLKSSDTIFFNIFKLDIPSQIFRAETPYRTSKNIFEEAPNLSFPAFDLDSGQLVSFNEFSKENPLFDFLIPETITSIDFEKFVEDKNNESVVVKILNRWIRSRCRKKGLFFDGRTKAYYYPRDNNGDGVVTAKWKAPTKESTRELTKPMKKGIKVNFWVHRSAVISSKTFWGEYYVQIKPRFLFSSDGSNLYDGVKTDKLDRNFRKSKYSHNLNQFYDVLFWYRHVFPETENLGNENIAVCLGFKPKPVLRVLDQIKIENEVKPNTEAPETLEDFEQIEANTANLEKLDAYLGE